MRIAIIDTSAGRAAVISDGLRDAGLDDLVLVDTSKPLVAQIEAAAPEVVLVNLENPSRDLLEDFFAMSRALARPIAMFVDQSDAEATGAAIDAGVSAYVVDGLSKHRILPSGASRPFHGCSANSTTPRTRSPNARSSTKRRRS
jgi:two-component system, response regulator / RNA-binding antiterminator